MNQPAEVVITAQFTAEDREDLIFGPRNLMETLMELKR